MSSLPAEAVVLAGGLGTRLRSVVSDVPKPMAPVNGRPFMEWLLEYWIGQGIGRFILSVGYLADSFVNHFGSAWGGAEFVYARETEPLGTGGGLLLASDAVRADDFLALNGDTLFPVSLESLATFHHAHGADCTFSLVRSSDTRRYMGLAVAPDGRILNLESEKSGYVNGGVYMLRKGALRSLPLHPGRSTSLEADLFPAGLRAGWKIFGLESGAIFIDIGLPEDYGRVAEFLKS
ncbi:MAG: phosphohexose mutase [Betaproteobacteria bacterium]|nr:phosphohexose mutase [Betaproteobacteria bacterium]